MADLVAFALVLGTITGLEFLDRTNFALITLAAREPPWAVWTGAALAFLATTVVSVAIGGAAVALLHDRVWVLQLGGGILLIGYAVLLAIRHDHPKQIRAGRSAFSTAFLMILLLELGDTTMLVTINFVIRFQDPLLVGAAAGLGLLAVAATACVLGPRLGARVEPKLLEKVVIVILLIVGAATILYAVDPGAFSVLPGI